MYCTTIERGASASDYLLLGKKHTTIDFSSIKIHSPPLRLGLLSMVVSGIKRIIGECIVKRTPHNMCRALGALD